MQAAHLALCSFNPPVSSSMELRRLLLLLVLFAYLSTAVSQTLHSDPIFSQSPTSAPASDADPAASSSAAYRRHHFRRILLGLLFGSLTGFLTSLLFIFSLRHCLFYATRAPILTGPVIFTPDISPADLLAALSGVDPGPHSTQLIGAGPCGKYQRVELQGGLVLAVKTIEPNCPDCSPSLSHPGGGGGGGKSARRQRRVQQALELLGMVRHRNVMPLRAYLLADGGEPRGRLSLVYDHMPHGSLEDAMKRVRSNQVRLGWGARHRIAVGVAKGLRHLHFECSPRILHGGLKPANVVLDEELEPRLTDCGLWAVVADDAGDGVGSYSNYTAPECFQNLRYTDKSDIFSFGVILGVLLTGRDPSDPFFGGEVGSFVRWLRHVQHTAAGADGVAKEALDKSMLGDEVEEEEMLMAVRIAVVCLSDSPADRPSSDELVAMLTQLHSF